MKVFHLILVASVFTIVHASGRASGWEAVMLYYSYRMDKESGGNNIGPGCTGTHSKGGCNFAEFSDYIQPKKIKTRVNGNRVELGQFDPSKIPANLHLDLETPDIATASQISDWEGTLNPQYPHQEPQYYHHDGTYVNKNVISSAGEKDKHRTIMKRVANIVQTTRSRPNAGDRASHLNKIMSCLNVIRAARIADNADNLPKAFDYMIFRKVNQPLNQNQHLKASVYSSSDLYGHTFNTFDTHQTVSDIENHPTLSPNQKKTLIDRVADYALNWNNKASLSPTPGSSGKSHYDVILDIQDISSKLQGNPNVYCQVT